jgi:hypothetical protein
MTRSRPKPSLPGSDFSCFFDFFDMVMIGSRDRHRKNRARIARDPQREAVRL